MRMMKKWSAFCLTLILVFGGMITVKVRGSEVNAAVKEESLKQTMNAETILAQRGGDTRLGAVSSTASKFTFKVTHPGSDITGQMKINVFSPGNDHIWQGGYLICVSAKTADTVDFALRNGNGEGLLSYPGEPQHVEAGEYMTISAWIEEQILYVSVNDITIMQYDNTAGTASVGVYNGVYNEMSSEMEFVNVPIEEPVENVESLLQTAGAEEVSAKQNGDTRLGALSSTTSKFSFKVTHPGSSITGQMKINVFSPGNDHIWQGGYLICVSAKTADTVDFALRNGNGEGLLSYPGEPQHVEAGEYMTISAWIEGNVFYVSVNGATIMQYDNTAGAVSVGVYNGVYNEMSAPMIFKSTTKAPEVVFEKLSQTVIASSNDYADLGQVSSTANGFAFKVNIPESTSDLKIGLFNTGRRNPWANGYILAVSPRTEVGTIGFALRRGSDEALLCYPGDTTGITGTQFLVQAWIANDTLYVAINGEIVLQWINDGSVQVDTYMSAYNGWSETAVFSAYIDDSNVTGDCNGDGTTNLKDLMCFKKYMAGVGSVNNQADLVKEGSEGIDRLDFDFLCRILLNPEV